MIVHLTKGWGGSEIVSSAFVTDLDRALEWLLRNAPNKAMIAPAFTYTAIERGLVIDYGSHNYFGFVPGAGLPDVNETAPTSKEKGTMKTNTKTKAKPDVKAKAKPDVKAKAKPEVKAETKPEVKAKAKADAKPKAKAKAKASRKSPNEALLEKRLRALDTKCNNELKAADKAGLCDGCKGMITTAYDTAAIVINLQHILFECTEAKNPESLLDVQTGAAIAEGAPRFRAAMQHLLCSSTAQFRALMDMALAMAAVCPRTGKDKAKAKAKAKAK